MAKKRTLPRRKRDARRLFAEALEQRMLLTTVMGLNPPANSHTAPVSTNISADFDQPIIPVTTNPLSFAVHSSQRGQLVGPAVTAVNTSVNTVTLDPASDFFAGEVVQGTATASILSTLAQPNEPYVWQLRTGVPFGLGNFVSGQDAFGSHSTLDVALGDVDGDGDLDAITANYGEGNRVWLSSGGTFSDSGQVLGTGDSAAIALGDVDGDSDLDAFVVNYSQGNRIWLNTGGTFTDSGQSLGTFTGTGVSLADLDGDGDLDAFVSNSAQANRVWINTGGVFNDSGQTLGAAGSNDVSVGDFDDDGDLDAFVANSGANVLWVNDGNANFTSGQTLGNHDTTEVALGDLDGDGDLDAFTSNYSGEANRVWLNTGGVLSDSGQMLGNHSSYNVNLGDVDGDGDLDAFVANSQEGNRVWLNSAGVFSDSGQSLGDHDSTGIAVGDIDNDGDVDAFVASFGMGNRVWINPNQTFTVEPALLELDEGNSGTTLFEFTIRRLFDTSGVASVEYGFTPSGPDPAEPDDFVGGSLPTGILNFADGVDSQTVSVQVVGDEEIEGNEGFALIIFNATGENSIIGNSTGQAVIRNDDNLDHGDLPSPYPTLAADNGPSHIATGPTLGASRDTEPDGQPTANADGDDTLGAADEDGVTFPAGAIPGGVTPVVVNASEPGRLDAWFDFDGDGTFNSAGEQIFDSVLLSAGDNNLSFGVPAHVSQGTAYARFRISTSGGLAPTGGALDGEVEDYAVTLAAPFGSGIFLDGGQTLGDHGSSAVALGDLDADGDLDAFVANYYNAQGNRIWLNDGGTFSDSGQVLGDHDSSDVALGDLDGDGDLDAFVTNSYQGDRVWINDDGEWIDSGQSIGMHNSSGVALGDLDGDGDLDAFVSVYLQGQRIFKNNGDGSFTDTGQNLGNRDAASVALGDFDGDGDLDAIIANRFLGNELLINSGTGIFSDSGQSLGNHDSSEVAVGDIDNDGDLDAVVANDAQGNRIWLNSGGIFTDSGQQLGDHSSQTVSLGDLDGDGDLDAVFGNSYTANRVWLNDGGIFSDSNQTLGLADTLDTAVGDLDNDGDLDVMLINFFEGNRIWLNQSLQFTAPLTAAIPEGNAGVVQFNFPVTREFDTLGTATVDYVVAPAGSDPVELDDLAGVFPSGTLTFPDGVSTVSIPISVTGDTDSETDEGFTITLSNATGRNPTILTPVIAGAIRNDDGIDLGDLPSPYPTLLADDGAAHNDTGPTLGASRDSEADGLPNAAADGDDLNSTDDENGVAFATSIVPGQAAAEVTVNASGTGLLDAWIDFNGDGSLDEAAERVFRGQPLQAGANVLTFGVPADAQPGTALSRFRLSTAGVATVRGGAADGEVEDHAVVIASPLGSGRFTETGESLGDHDSLSVALGDVDGDGDLDAFVASLDPNRLWINEGGLFTDSGQAFAELPSTDAALGDLDGDGDLDAFVVNRQYGSRVYLNTGGVFTDTGQDLGENPSEAVALGDLDGDGDLDAFVANGGAGDRVWLNDGTGQFVDSGQTMGSDESSDVELGDLDGDGDLDAFVTDRAIGNRVWLNHDGRFTDSGQLLGDHNSLSASLGDLDGDGDLDAFVANYSGGQANRVLLNDGGVFTDSGQELGNHGSYGLALGDLDGDGDLDAFVANSNQGNRVWLNSNGVFSDSGQEMGTHDSLGVALGDLDGDGDIDAFVANIEEGNRVWLNRNPTLSIEPVSVSLPEGNAGTTRFTFNVVRLFDTTGSAAVDFAFVPSGADPAELDDFAGGTLPSGRLVLNDGVASVPLAVDVVGDLDVEGEEQFSLVISNPDNAAISLDTATATIRNDDNVDLGDLPLPFPTTLALNGPAHIATGPTLGTGRDVEADGQPSAAADADDLATSDDEDGVTFASAVLVGQEAQVIVLAGDAGLLDAWIDFNGDESFGGAGEQIASRHPVAAGINFLSFQVPEDARQGSTFSRFRLSTAGGLGPAGGAADGEVEDHTLTIGAPGGTGFLVDSGQGLGDHSSYGVALGDLDGDGDLDAFSAVLNGPDRIWLNEAGVLTDSGQTLADHDSTDVALGDLDGDGDLDAFVAERDSGNRIWLNDGGVLTDTGQVLGNSSSRAVALGDLDGDGDLDAFVANYGSSNSVWFNDGGVFTDSLQRLGSSNSADVALADVDGDGDLDAFVANNRANRVWLNNSGEFNDSGQLLGNHDSLGVSLGDLDGDGDLDAFVANNGNSGDRVWLNSNGVFIDSLQELGDHRSYGVALGDLDGDGDLDALVANSNQANRIWTNTGGVFADSGQTLGDHDSLATAIGDLDGDGDLDAFVSNFDQADRVWLNQLPSLLVTSLTQTSTGFVAEFGSPLDTSVLNLYDTQTGGLGAADVVLQGQSSGPVSGSLIVSETAVTFVKTGGSLAADTYTLTLRSAADGFVSTTGLLLDGNGDGTTGDDYVESFTVTPAAGAVTVSVPDFVRGPGQPVNLPADSTLGFPLTLSDGTGVRTVEMQLSYDPALLDITGAAVADGLPAGAAVSLDTPEPGVAVLNFTSPADLPAGETAFVNLQAVIPTDNANAIYRSKQVLDINSLIVRDGASNVLPSIDDDGVHIVMYLSDASGNGRINAADASRVARVAALLDSGFSAGQLADPLLIGDITGNGRLNAADASRVARVGALLPVDEVPPIPAGVVTGPITGGPDPKLWIPQDLEATAGGSVSVPLYLDSLVNLQAPNRLAGADVLIQFDPQVFAVTSITAGGFIENDRTWGFFPNIDNEQGRIVILAFTGIPTRGEFEDVLVNLNFAVKADAPLGASPINILAADQGRLTDLIDESDGYLTLYGPPTNAADDEVDGLVTVKGGVLNGDGLVSSDEGQGGSGEDSRDGFVGPELRVFGPEPYLSSELRDRATQGRGLDPDVVDAAVEELGEDVLFSDVDELLGDL